MMKMRYFFTTDMTLDELESVLMKKAQHWSFNALLNSDVYVYSLKKGKLHLLKTGSMGIGGGQPLFQARCVYEDHTLRINGYFTYSLFMKILAYSMFSAIFLAFLFNISIGFWNKLLLLAAWELIISIIFYIGVMCSNLIFMKRNTQALDFLEAICKAGHIAV